MGFNGNTSVSLTLVITMFGFLFTGLTTYFTVTYSFANEINLIKVEAEAKDDRIASLEEEIKTYRLLPAKIESIDETTNETHIIVGVIRDALIAAKIIKPRS